MSRSTKSLEMQQQTYAILFLLAGILPGCTAFDSLTERPIESSLESMDKMVLKGSFSLDGSEETQVSLAALNREFIRDTLKDTARGSRVHIVDAEDHRYIGTLLRSGSDQVELFSCMSREVVSAPDGQRQCKTSHVAFQTLPVATMTHFTVLSKPPADFPATDDEIDDYDLGIDALVFKSGRRQSWGRNEMRSEK